MSRLLEPLKIRHLVLQNRLVMPPMATAKSEADGRVSQALIDYYAERAAGGHLGLIITEHSYIRADGKASANQLSVASDADVEGLGRLAAAIHRGGASCAAQINHAGSATTAETIGGRPIGPSAVRNPRKGELPRELDAGELPGLVAAFREAARRVKEAGFDAVEIHSAHGYFLNQFLSPLTNKRRDGYGGALQSRIRLHLEVIEAVRAVVGPDYPILLRLGASDFAEGGTTVDEACAAARAFERAGVDLLDISGGFCGYTLSGNAEQGYFAPLSRAVKAAVNIPVILTGGITSGEAAERLLIDGAADLIGVGRAILADPAWAGGAVAGLRRAPRASGERGGSTRKYAVVGSVNMDMVTRVRRFPGPGETVSGISFGIFPGGKGANQAVALGRLGAEVSMVGRVGDDLFGAQYRRVLESEGVDLSRLETVTGGATGTASIEVSDTGENHIVIVSGTNGLVDRPFVERSRRIVEGSDFLLLQMEIPLDSVLLAATLARGAGRTVILDPAPAQPLPSGLAALVDIVTPNETEAKLLTGIDTETELGIREAGARLLASGIGTVIVKAGARGAYIVAEGRFERVPGFAVRAVDTTAAGDSFNAGLAVALGDGLELAAAVRYANAVAAISTTRDGAQAAMPGRQEVAAFLAGSP